MLCFDRTHTSVHNRLKSNATLMLLLLFLFRMLKTFCRTVTLTANEREKTKCVSAVCFIFDVSFWYFPSSVCALVFITKRQNEWYKCVYWTRTELWRIPIFVLLYYKYKYGFIAVACMIVYVRLFKHGLEDAVAWYRYWIFYCCVEVCACVI